MAPVASSLPPSALSGHHQGSVLLAEEQVAIDLEPSESSALLPKTQTQAMVYDETVCVSLHFLHGSIHQEVVETCLKWFIVLFRKRNLCSFL